MLKKLLPLLVLALFISPSAAFASVSCDGTVDGSASTAGSADTNIPTNGDFTATFWIKYTTSAPNFTLGINGNFDVLAFNTSDDVANTLTAYILNFNTSANTTSNDGAWHSIVFTRSGNTTTVYQDKVAGTTGNGGHSINSSNPLEICRTSAANRWTGKIAKFAFYNSIAWSQAQVDSYHDSGGVTIPASPQVQYNFASSGALLTDSSGNGHTLVPNGTGLGFVYDSDEPSGGGGNTVNRLAKFVTSNIVGNSLFSDDGSNMTLISGNLFMQIGSLIDTVAGGAFNFGTANATILTFGRSGQNMIINSKVGIGTSTPTAMLHVNGDIFGNVFNLAANGLGLDTLTSGTLSIGSTTANAVTIGRIGATTTIPTLLVGKHGTSTNCNSIASPAVCGSAPSGSVAMATGTSTLVVNTTAVTADSQILVTEDSSLGTRLGITCNTNTNRNYSISTRTSGTSFTIKSSVNPNTNKSCLSYWIVN